MLPGILLTLLVACSVPRAIRHGEALLGAGDPAAALEVFRQITATHPEHARALRGEALALAELGRPRDAAATAHRAWTADAAVGLDAHGLGLISTGRCPEARALLEDSEHSVLKAWAELGCGDRSLARTLLSSAPPDDFASWIAYRLSEGEAPPHANLLADRAQGWLSGAPNHLDAGDAEGALRMAARARAAGADAQITIARTWLAIGEPARGLAELAQVSEPSLLMVDLLEAAERTDEAADVLEEVLRRHGASGEALRRLAVLLERAQRRPESARAWRAAATLGDRHARLEVARRSLHAGQPAHSLQQLDRLLAEDPYDPDALAIRATLGP